MFNYLFLFFSLFLFVCSIENIFVSITKSLSCGKNDGAISPYKLKVLLSHSFFSNFDGLSKLDKNIKIKIISLLLDSKLQKTRALIVQLYSLSLILKKKKTKCNHLLLCCLIVKLKRILYKNIWYGNLRSGWVVLEQTLKKLTLFRNKHFGTENWVKQFNEIYFIARAYNWPKQQKIRMFKRQLVEHLGPAKNWKLTNFLRNNEKVDTITKIW